MLEIESDTDKVELVSRAHLEQSIEIFKRGADASTDSDGLLLFELLLSELDLRWMVELSVRLVVWDSDVKHELSMLMVSSDALQVIGVLKGQMLDTTLLARLDLRRQLPSRVEHGAMWLDSDAEQTIDG